MSGIERRAATRRPSREDPTDEPRLRAIDPETPENALRRENVALRDAYTVAVRYLRRALREVKGPDQMLITEDIVREPAIVAVGGLPEDKL